jgi:uncharacterized protein DUF5666
MSARQLKWLISCATLALLAAGTALAQSGRAGTPNELMAALKVGQWVKIEGPAGNTPVVQCSEAKMLTGDFLDGDWEITADVRRVDAAKGTFTVFTMPCKLADGCTFKSKSNPGFKGLEQLKAGMYVNVEGTFLRDGTLLARKVGDKKEDLVEKPEHKGLVRMRGRIDKVNPAAQSVTVMGITFQINSRTQAKSVIR